MEKLNITQVADAGCGDDSSTYLILTDERVSLLISFFGWPLKLQVDSVIKDNNILYRGEIFENYKERFLELSKDTTISKFDSYILDLHISGFNKQDIKEK